MITISALLFLALLVCGLFMWRSPGGKVLAILSAIVLAIICVGFGVFAHCIHM